MATFGTTSQGSTGFDNPADNVVWCQATSNPSAGTLTQIAFIGQAKVGTPTVEVAIYSDNAGVAGNRLAVSAGTVSVTTLGTYQVNISQALTASTQYWLAVNVTNYGGASNDVEIAYDSVGGNELNYINNGGGTFPANGSGANLATERWSVWGIYTPSGGAAASTWMLMGVGP